MVAVGIETPLAKHSIAKQGDCPSSVNGHYERRVLARGIRSFLTTKQIPRYARDDNCNTNVTMSCEGKIGKDSRPQCTINPLPAAITPIVARTNPKYQYVRLSVSRVMEVTTSAISRNTCLLYT